MQAGYQVDHLTSAQQEVVYKLCLSTFRSNGSQPEMHMSWISVTCCKSKIKYNFHSASSKKNVNLGLSLLAPWLRIILPLEYIPYLTHFLLFHQICNSFSQIFLFFAYRIRFCPFNFLLYIMFFLCLLQELVDSNLNHAKDKGKN